MSRNLDELASGLASGTITRRRALAAIGAGALGALVPWASRAQAQPGCREEGHPCEGNQECCEGLRCGEKGEVGPGNARRCTSKPAVVCDKKKPCKDDKDCDTKKGFKCTCKQEVAVEKDLSCKKTKKGTECEKAGCKCTTVTETVKKEECDPKKPKCDKGCECKKDEKTKKYFCVCKVEKKVCVCKVEKKFCEKVKKH